MIIENLDLVARRENRTELLAALAYLLGPLRVESGCLGCWVYQDMTDPQHLRFECHWREDEDLLRHLRSDIYKQLLILLELSAELPSVQFHEISGSRGLEYVRQARGGLAMETDPPDSEFRKMQQEKTA